MGKEKKSLGIKTTRYFTKNCSKCNFEYPNWFTNCPKCGTSWDEVEAKKSSKTTETHTKKIKIVAKITEEDFNKIVLKVHLIFSANQGKSWYQMQMDSKMDYYIAEIAEIPAGSVIIYYIEVYLENGEKIIENNENKYYYYKVGISMGEPEEKPSDHERKSIKGKIRESEIKPQQYLSNSIESQISQPHLTRSKIEKSINAPLKPINSTKRDNSRKLKSKEITIFDNPQTKIDPDLKICTYCNSKIKKMWSTCPICGNTL